MNVMSVSLAKELLAGLGLEEEDDSSAAAEPPAASGGGKQLSQEEIEKLLAAEQSRERTTVRPGDAFRSGGGKQLSQEEIEKDDGRGAGEAPAESPQQLSSAPSEPAGQSAQAPPASSEPAVHQAMPTPALCRTGTRPKGRPWADIPVLPISTLSLSSPGSSGSRASRAEGDQHHACRYAGNGRAGDAWKGTGGKSGPDHGGPAADYRGDRADPEKSAGNPGLFQGLSCCAG